MAGLEDLPLVALENLLPRLDRESLIAASKVCVSWRKIVHDFTSRRISNVDSDLRDKLEKCGWIMSEHDVERCSCIDLYTSLFKFIGNVPMSCRVLLSVEPIVDIYLHFTRYKFKLFFSTCVEYSEDDLPLQYVIRLVDLDQETIEPIDPWKKLWKAIQAMHLHDKTIALIEVDYDEDPDALEVCILNHETLQFVQYLSGHTLDMFIGLTQEEFDAAELELHGIALAEDKLAQNFVIDVGRSVSYQTQIWKLDTANPSNENIHYWTTIEHNITDDNIYILKTVMNSELLCLAIKFNTQKKIVLKVLLFDDFSRQTVTVFEEIDVDIISRFHYDVVIDSKRVSVFDKRNFILKVYEFDGANVSCLEVDLSQYAKDSDVMVLNRFMMGKVMLFLCSVGKFKCILVNEDGVVIEGINQQLQNPDQAFNVNEIYQSCPHVNPFHANADGIVAVTKKEGRKHYQLYYYN